MARSQKLPTDLSGQTVRKALERRGFFLRRQKGSHMVMVRATPPCRVVVPDHQHVRIGTLRQILAATGLTREDFLAAVRGKE